MGGCISATLANFFLSHYEKIWLEKCPSEFKPILYKRYVDDTFILFKNYDHITKFLNYLNSRHPNIEFTSEIEKNDSLSFLDVLISKTTDSFITNSFQKKTQKGLGMKFSSAIPEKYKFNLIKCLIDRAYKINSTMTGFCIEIERLKKYFFNNEFPARIITNTISKKLQELKSERSVSVAKKKIYASLPYLNKISNKNINRDLRNLITRFYPHINLNLIFNNDFSIESFFPFKDRIPTPMLSNLVYKYTCEQCDATYYGETSRHLLTRIAEHKGLSPRSNLPITHPSFSSIRDHAIEMNHNINLDNFSILFRSRNNGSNFPQLL